MTAPPSASDSDAAGAASAADATRPGAPWARPTPTPPHPHTHPRTRAPAHPNRVLRVAARILFLVSLASLGYVWYRRHADRTALPPPGTGPEPPLRLDWDREPFAAWSSPEDGVALRYPARYEAARGFGRFTSRDLLGDLEETDLVAFRSAAPRSVVTVALYRSPRIRPWHEWDALARVDPGVPKPAARATAPSSGLFARVPPAALAYEFGGSDRRFRRTFLGGRPALAVTALGALRYPVRGAGRMELWRFESRFLAAGDRALRITAGAPAETYPAAAPGLRRVLDSLRWTAR